MEHVFVEYYRDNETLIYKDIFAVKENESYVSYVRLGDSPSSLPDTTIAVCYPQDYSWQPVTFEKKDGGWIEKV